MWVTRPLLRWQWCVHNLCVSLYERMGNMTEIRLLIINIIPLGSSYCCMRMANFPFCIILFFEQFCLVCYFCTREADSKRKPTRKQWLPLWLDPIGFDHGRRTERGHCAAFAFCFFFQLLSPLSPSWFVCLSLPLHVYLLYGVQVFFCDFMSRMEYITFAVCMCVSVFVFLSFCVHFSLFMFFFLLTSPPPPATFFIALPASLF